MLSIIVFLCIYSPQNTPSTMLSRMITTVPTSMPKKAVTVTTLREPTTLLFPTAVPRRSLTTLMETPDTWLKFHTKEKLSILKDQSLPARPAFLQAWSFPILQACPISILQTCSFPILQPRSFPILQPRSFPILQACPRLRLRQSLNGQS